MMKSLRLPDVTNSKVPKVTGEEVPQVTHDGEVVRPLVKTGGGGRQ